MVDAERRNAADCRSRNNIGRVEPAAEAYLDDASIGGGAGKGEKRDGGGHFEKARLQPIGMVQHFGKQRGQHGVVDEFTRDPNTLIKADQMRAGVDMGGQSCRFDGGA